MRALLDLVKKRFDVLKLLISHEKSQIISADDVTWNLLDHYTNVEMSLKQVAQYKYLGTWTFGSMYKTGVEKQKLCVKTATKYKNCCIYVSKMGPDVVDVVLCTWSNVAIPAILTGCEMIPFCETKISEIERIQAQVAKFALGVSSSFPNISSQSELGLKPFRQILYERQIKFFFRLLYLPAERWAHQALQEHLSGVWSSSYMPYIASIRSELRIFTSTNIPSFWKPLSAEFFLARCNKSLEKHQWVRPVKKLSRASYVSENDMSAVITEFKFDNANLGNKSPRLGYMRKLYCPLCPVQHLNNGLHLLFVCGSLSLLRVASGIQSFITACSVQNRSLESAYALFVNGEDVVGKSVSVQDYIERGKCMNDMRALWLSKW